MKSGQDRTWKTARRWTVALLTIVGLAIAAMAMLGRSAQAEPTRDVRLVPEGTAGALGLTGSTFTQVAAQLATGDDEVIVGVPGLPPGTELTLTAGVSDQGSSRALVLAGETTVRGTTAQLGVAAAWPDDTSTSPEVTVAVKVPGPVGLSNLTSGWVAPPVDPQLSDAVALVSTASSIDPSAYPPSLAQLLGADPVLVGPGVHLAATLGVPDGSALDAALSPLGIPTSGLRLEGTLAGSLAGLLADHDADDPDDADRWAVDLALAVPGGSTPMSWLERGEMVASFEIESGGLPVVDVGYELTASIDGSVNTFAGSVRLDTGAATLDANLVLANPDANQLDPPGVLDWLPTLSNVELSLSLTGGSSPSMSAALAADVELTAGVEPRLIASIEVDGSSVRLDVTLEGDIPLAALVSAISDAAGLGIDVTGVADALGPISIDRVGLELTRGGGDVELVATTGLSRGSLALDLLLSFRAPAGGPSTIVVGVDLSDDGCDDDCIRLGSIITADALPAAVADLEFPAVGFATAFQPGSPGGVSLTGGDLSDTEREFFGRVHNLAPGSLLPDDFELSDELSWVGQVDLDRLPGDVRDVLGIASGETVKISGNVGVSLSNVASSPSFSLDSLSLRVDLPPLSGGLLPDWLSVDSAHLELAYQDGSLRLGTGGSATISDIPTVGGGTTSISMTLDASLAVGGGETTFELSAGVGTIDLGLDWLTIDSATFDLSITKPASGPAAVTAGLAAEVTVAGEPFSLEVSIGGSSGSLSLELTLRYLGSIGVNDLIGAVFGDASLTVPEPLDVQFSGIGISARISSGQPFALAATGTGSITLGDSSLEVTLLGGLRGTSAYLAAVPTADITLNEILDGLPDASFELPSVALMVGTSSLSLTSASLLPVERDVFEDIYCDSPGCTFTTQIPGGVGLVGGIGLPDELGDALQPIGLDTSQKTIITGTAPIFGGGDLGVDLSVQLPPIQDVSFAPEWFDSFSLSLYLRATVASPSIDLGLEGTLSLKLKKLDDPVSGGHGDVCGPEDSGRVRLSSADQQFYCYDILQFTIGAEISIAAGPPITVEVTLSGEFFSPGGWQSPFGIDFLTINRARVEISIGVTGGPSVALTVGFGMAVDAVVADVDMFASVAFGVNIMPNPPWVIPDFKGIRISSNRGLETNDVPKVLSAISRVDIDTSAIPNIALRNFDLMVSRVDDPNFCLVSGIAFAADLYVNPTAWSGDDEAVDGADPNAPSCNPLPSQRPNAAAHCVSPAGKAAGCLASVAAEVTPNGIILRGALQSFELGLFEMEATLVDLTLTLDQQRFRLSAGASVDGVFAGSVRVDLERDGLGARFALRGLGDLFDGTFRAYVEAQAALNFTNPDFSFRAVLLSDFQRKFNDAVAPTARTIVIAADAIDGFAAAALDLSPSRFIEEIEKVARATGGSTPAWLSDVKGVLREIEKSPVSVNWNLLLKGVDLQVDFGWPIGKQGIKIPGVCDLLSIPSGSCSVSGLVNTYVLPQFQGWVHSATGINLPIGSLRQLASQITAGNLPVDLRCVEFSAALGDLAEQGGASVATAFDLNLFNVDVQWGMQVNFPGFHAAQGSNLVTTARTYLTTLLHAFLDPTQVICRGLPADAFDVRLALSTDRTSYTEGDAVTLSVAGTVVEGSPPEFPVEVTIDWGDGNVEERQVDSLSLDATHTYADDLPTGVPGANYTVSVSYGDLSEAVIIVPVANDPPSIDELAVTPAEIDEGDVVTLTGSFSDAGMLDTHTVRIDWGDGTVSEHELAAGDRSFEATHTYLDDVPSFVADATYEIEVQVTDDDTGTGSDTVDVTVRDVVPDDITITPMLGDGETIDEGAEVTYEVSFDDEGVLDQHLVTIDWGEKVGDPIVDTYRVGDFCISETLRDGLADEGIVLTDPSCDDAPDHALALGSSCDVVVDPDAEDVDCNDPWILATYAPSAVSSGGTVRTLEAAHVYVDDDPTATAADLYDIAVTVENDDTNSATIVEQVTVHNVDPTIDDLTIDEAVIDEGDQITISATISDPGTRDTFEIDIDWGYRGFDQTLSTTTLSHGDLDCAVDSGGRLVCTFEASHRYGDTSVFDDNTEFTIAVTVTDDDTGTAVDTVQVRVDNTDPTNVLDRDGAEDVQGEDTFLTRVDVPLTFTTEATDRGSDDLTVTWDWDDGTTAVGTHLVEGPDPDPAPSPDVDPRDVTDIQTKAWDRACLYDVSVVVADDDGGVSPEERVWALVFGWADRARAAGWWLSEYMQESQKVYDQEQLVCFLRMVNHMSAVFDEERGPLETLDDAVEVLRPGPQTTPRDLLDTNLLGAWLNVAAGAHDYLEVRDDLAAIEAVRLDPDASPNQLRAATRDAQRLNR